MHAYIMDYAPRSFPRNGELSEWGLLIGSGQRLLQTVAQCIVALKLSPGILFMVILVALYWPFLTIFDALYWVIVVPYVSHY